MKALVIVAGLLAAVFGGMVGLFTAGEAAAVVIVLVVLGVVVYVLAAGMAIARWAAIALGVVFVAAFVIRGMLPILVKKLTETTILTSAMFIAAVAFTLLPFFVNPYALAAIAFLLGLGVGCAQPMTMSLLYLLTPAGRIAESFGLQKTVRNATHFLVPIIFGSVGAAFGVTTVFISNTVILVTSGFLLRRAGMPDSDSRHK